MLAPCFNKEKLGRKDIAATLVIFAGATIAVVFASHTSPSYNLSMLMELYRDPLTCKSRQNLFARKMACTYLSLSW